MGVTVCVKSSHPSQEPDLVARHLSFFETQAEVAILANLPNLPKFPAKFGKFA